MVQNKLEQAVEEKLEEQIYFTLRGCRGTGTVEIPKTLFNFIYNISGTCTDSNETEDYYKNPRAMFVALDLIYIVLDEIRKEQKIE